ncbi:hypothetical protein ACFVQB_14365 [Paenibacillus sp. NPDC057886]|uniref:hypothetical protein n=1 Tax=Paenibacillus sp. NPDC057886 TaxID=3346270 RepID=UPI0036ACBA9E
MDNIRTKEAAEIRKQWKEKHGDESCDHPYLLREYEKGSSTGDYVCVKCGESDWGARWNEK